MVFGARCRKVNCDLILTPDGIPSSNYSGYRLGKIGNRYTQY